ncbi:C1 family peptidase [Reichenbachiella carrageenanivorans]|uniref:Aminopeptidase n=1 Tax=Reichenbachiella carrageenanivorans TaxID=2979869 RepID=A0ABY6CW91_9BACT|nr:C1 family peptidase [Reichenbachiella carrageenanivorans]UXX78182.1 C1 family peptidase [Reichenbachiella carrageenanivorans]
MRHLFTLAALALSLSIHAQDTYEFSTTVDLASTPIISQGQTGTCWSFSASSFIESEIIRKTGKTIDLSEMYTVRQTYMDKAENYIMRQGKANFSEGGLAHDVLNSIKANGLVPQDAYNGLDAGSSYHNHKEMVAILESMLTTYVENPNKKLSKKWRATINAVLDIYIGATPETFTFEGKTYTPQSFSKMTSINPDDYVSLTSFTHEPFYSSFILNIPDNFSNGSFYNLPLDELIQTLKHSLANGYSVELDCDVSEPTFSAKHGLAVIPADQRNNQVALDAIYPELDVTQQYRQDEFENYTTTDDHLMHITGMLKDQKGNTYYKVKNSWGNNSNYISNDGYINMSESYMRLKTISITLHKDAIPKNITKKLAIK